MARLLDYARRRWVLLRYLGYALVVALVLLTLALSYALFFRDEPAQIPPAAPPVLDPLSLGPVGEGAPLPPTSVALPQDVAATPPLLQPTLQRPIRIPTPPPRRFPTPPATETPLPTLITPAATAIPSPSPMPPPTPLAQATPPATPLPTEPSPATVIPHPTPTAEPKPRPTIAAPTATPILRHTAGIALLAEPDRIAAGQQLQLRIVVQAGETNPVDTVQVYLAFDPAIFEAAAVAAGPDLEVPLQSRVDNNRGRIDYAAGTTVKAMTAPFTLATVTFRARSATGTPGTYITFAALQSPRQTKAIARGDNRTGSLTSAYIVVN